MQIHQYHAYLPSWRRGLDALSGEWVGLELEVMHQDGREYVADALDDVDFGEFPEPVAEEDGSLSRTYGVEIVCPPLPLAEVLADDGYIARIMTRLRELGTDEGTVGYGMHINFNVRDWPQDLAQMVAYLISCDRNATEAAGGRQLTAACSEEPYLVIRDNSSGALTLAGTKYMAARLRGMSGGRDILEFRAPASTLVHNNLRRAIEYVYSIKSIVQQNMPHWKAACMMHRNLAQLRSSNRTRTSLMQLQPTSPYFSLEAYLASAHNIVLPNVGGFYQFPFMYRTGVPLNDLQDSFESAIAFCRAVAEGGTPWVTGSADAPTRVEFTHDAQDTDGRRSAELRRIVGLLDRLQAQSAERAGSSGDSVEQAADLSRLVTTLRDTYASHPLRATGGTGQ